MASTTERPTTKLRLETRPAPDQLKLLVSIRFLSGKNCNPGFPVPSDESWLVGSGRDVTEDRGQATTPHSNSIDIIQQLYPMFFAESLRSIEAQSLGIPPRLPLVRETRYISLS
jgi:hypothetical protein